jgi:hypothetical protein
VIPAIETAPSGITPVAPITQPATSVPSTSSAKGKAGSVDVAAYWIDKYSVCKEKRIDYGERLASGFASAMKWMGHNVRFTRGNADASPKQWHAWGDKSQYGIDTVQFVYLATHSATHGKEGSATPAKPPPQNWVYFWLGTFDSSDGCQVFTVKAHTIFNPHTQKWRWEPTDVASPVVWMRLGEGRLRWLVLDCCNSLQVGIENIRPVRGYTTAKEAAAEKQLFESCNPALTWSRCCDGINTIFGFTGLSTDSEGTSTRGHSFGRRAGRGEAMGDAWIDEAYSWWNNDNPVVFSCGTSEADAEKRANGETLKSPARGLNHPQIGGFAWIWRS